MSRIEELEAEVARLTALVRRLNRPMLERSRINERYCLEALTELGPSLVATLVEDIGMDRHLVQAALVRLEKAGQVKRENRQFTSTRGQPAWVWELVKE